MGTKNIFVKSGKIIIDEAPWEFRVAKYLPIFISLAALCFSGLVFFSDSGYRERAIKPRLNIWFSDDPYNEEGIGWFVHNAGMGSAVIKKVTVEYNDEKAITENMEEDPVWHFFRGRRDLFLSEAKKIMGKGDIPPVGLDGISLKHAIQNGTTSKFLYVRQKDAVKLNKDLLEWFANQVNLKITIEYVSLLEKETYVSEHNLE